MIRLAFSTNAFKKNTLTEAVDAIASAGYAGVELMADVPHAYPPTFDDAQRRAFRHQLVKRKLAVSNINAFTLFADGDTYHPTWIEDSAARRDQRIDHTIACIELAEEFSAATVSIQPGGPLIGTSIDREVAGERFANGIEKVLPALRRSNVTLAIEPEPGLFIQTASEYLEFKNRFFRNEPLVRMNCDIGHLFCVGDSPAGVISAHPAEIAHVHLEDIGEDRVHQHLTPGKGVIDIAGVFKALDVINYSGWVTVELYPYETTAAKVAAIAFEHLRPMVNFQQ